jgi:hypothetical protein
MTITTRLIALTLAGAVGLNSTVTAQESPEASDRGTVIWTIGGASGGFGIGLWTGLTKFDDAINSDRKVWTSAVVGAAVGAVGGYLIGRSRARRPRSMSSLSARPSSVALPLPRATRSDRAVSDIGVPTAFPFRPNGDGQDKQADARTK